MRRGAYHSVVKCKSDPVLFRQMTVYNVNTELIRIAKSCEDDPCVMGRVLSFSDADDVVVRKEGKLLLVAEKGAILTFLSFFKEAELIIVIAVNKHQRRIWRIVTIFHSGRKRTFVFFKLGDHRRSNLNALADARERIRCDRAGAKQNSLATLKLDDG